MSEGEQKSPGSGKNKLTPLTQKQSESVIKGMQTGRATFFDWEQFQELTKILPPNTRISDILKSLRRKK